MKKSSGQDKIYDMITDRIIKLIEEKAMVPWKKPWVGGRQCAPVNFKPKKLYRGINAILLYFSDFSSRYWVTFKQVKELGGHVKQGEKSTPVIYWNWIEREEKNENTGKMEEKKIPFLRYYNVFNLEQCEGIEVPDAPEPVNDHPSIIEAAEEIIDNMPNKPVITNKENSAFYSPLEDRVNVPEKKFFFDDESYYCCTFHELGHSSGHEKRLGRQNSTEKRSFKSEKYSKEELCAEMTACFLCSEAGIVDITIENSAVYIKGWLTALKNDNRLLIKAAAQAQKAVDYILDVQHS